MEVMEMPRDVRSPARILSKPLAKINRIIHHDGSSNHAIPEGKESSERKGGLTREQVAKIISETQEARNHSEITTEERKKYFDIVSVVYRNIMVESNVDNTGKSDVDRSIALLKQQLIQEELFETVVTDMLPKDSPPLERALFTQDISSMFYLIVGGKLDRDYVHQVKRLGILGKLAHKENVSRTDLAMKYLASVRRSAREEELAQGENGVAPVISGFELEKVNLVEQIISRASSENVDEDVEQIRKLHKDLRLFSSTNAARVTRAVDYTPAVTMFKRLGLLQSYKHETTQYIREIVSCPFASPYSHPIVLRALNAAGVFHNFGIDSFKRSLLHMTLSDNEGRLSLSPDDTESMTLYAMLHSAGLLYHEQFGSKAVNAIESYTPGDRSQSHERYSKISRLPSGKKVFFPFHVLRNITNSTLGITPYPNADSLPPVAVEVRGMELSQIEDANFIMEFNHFAGYGIRSEKLRQQLEGKENFSAGNSNQELAEAWKKLRTMWEEGLKSCGVQIPPKDEWHGPGEQSAPGKTGYEHFIDELRLNRQKASPEYAQFTDALTHEMHTYVETARRILGFA